MDRRKALAMLTGIAASSGLMVLSRPAFAQTAASLIGADAHKAMTLQVGTLSLEMSQLAETRASHPKVREFAGFETAEQTSIAQVLTNVANPSPAPLNNQQAAMLQNLQGLSGKAFDSAYVDGEIQGHNQLLDIQQRFLDGRPDNLDDQHIAILARTVIMMHLTMLQDLRTQLSA